jgi:hypothetical protein
MGQPVDNVTQDVRLEQNGRILWYFSVGDRSAFPTEMKYYDVETMISAHPDPYRFNTFGSLLDSPDLVAHPGNAYSKVVFAEFLFDGHTSVINTISAHRVDHDALNSEFVDMRPHVR